MCEICGQIFGHHPRCPEYNSRDGAICICDECGEGIHNGEELFEHKGKRLCSECLENMSAKDILTIVGLSMRKVSSEELLDI